MDALGVPSRLYKPAASPPGQAGAQQHTSDNMRLLVVLSAVVLAALARPAYPGAAGTADLQGSGIGIGAPANAARGIAPRENIAVGDSTGGGDGSEYTVSLYCYGPANIQIAPEDAPVYTRVVETAKAAHARVGAQTQARDAAQSNADTAAGINNGSGASVGARNNDGVGSGIGDGVGARHGSGLTATAGVFCYGKANIKIGPAGVVHTPV